MNEVAVNHTRGPGCIECMASLHPRSYCSEGGVAALLSSAGAALSRELCCRCFCPSCMLHFGFRECFERADAKNVVVVPHVLQVVEATRAAQDICTHRSTRTHTDALTVFFNNKLLL